ncbi:MAG: LCP family protein [Clostridiales bacterium]|jgi:LCP family protein required for cell wall assembly|nr:LCP family protein [Clostridiales bacterium]
MKKRKRALPAVLIAIAVVIAAGFVAAYAFVKGKTSKVNYLDIKPGLKMADEGGNASGRANGGSSSDGVSAGDLLSEMDIPEDFSIPEEMAQRLESYRNILILGLDSRSDSYSSPSRADSIIIASLNEKTGEVKLASVYRDTFLEIPGHSLDKVNHSYAFGEGLLAMNALNLNLDLNITEFAAINFEAASYAVNLVHGIDIDVTSEEIKYINGYIDEIARVTGLNSSNIYTPGLQTLDGVQALAYSRIRYTSGGDYKRTERMRTVISKFFGKVQTLSLPDMNKLLDTILPYVYTNINPSEMISRIPEAINYKIVSSFGWPFETQGATIGGIFYGLPNSLEQNVISLHKELFGEENYAPSSNVIRISDYIKTFQ